MTMVSKILVAVAAVSVSSEMLHDSQHFGDHKPLVVAAGPTVKSKFCTSMADNLYMNGAKTPSSVFEYDLCIDTATTSWKQVAVDKKTNSTITVIVDGKNMYKYDKQLNTCVTSPAPAAPLTSMPFTMINIDPTAEKNGTATVDGVSGLTVLHSHRAKATHGHFFQPVEDMFWYVNSKNELVQGKCVIKKQPNYPEDTVAYHDYFSRGKYTEDVAADTFVPDTKWKCPPSATVVV